ncbi:hypothetical protein B0H11DRAFT_2031666, partial [Mycena galericulata]
MADCIPDEIVSEILSPLLKYSDEVFSDTSEKTLLSPGYSSSTYLLVCKSWLRVSTPLLYSVVILRTTAQAEALGKILQSNPEFGLFIRQLRVEGGFGRVMHAILKCAPNITDLFLTLFIWGKDDSSGLCAGLPLINPQRIILVDGASPDAKPKNNKQATKLLDMIIHLLPKWDKLTTFRFPYLGQPFYLNGPVFERRAEALAFGLRQSPSLQTLVVRAGNIFPEYLHQMADAPSLESIHMTFGDWMGKDGGGAHFLMSKLKQDLNALPKLKRLVTFESLDSVPPMDDIYAELFQLGYGTVVLKNGRSFESAEHMNDTSEDEVSTSTATNFQCLETLANTSGSTLQRLTVSFPEPVGLRSKKPVPAENPAILMRFNALTHLTWLSPNRFSFSKPPFAFAALSNLHVLRLSQCSSSVIDVFSELPLDLLRDLSLGRPLDVSASLKLFRRHGRKLLELSAPLKILAKFKVFDVLPEDFISCSAPHTTLAKIRFDFHYLYRQHEFAMKSVFTALDATRFPNLKEIKVDCIKWPTSEQEIRKNKWVPLSELLRTKGIKLVASDGVSWSARS